MGTPIVIKSGRHVRLEYHQTAFVTIQHTQAIRGRGREAVRVVFEGNPAEVAVDARIPLTEFGKLLGRAALAEVARITETDIESLEAENVITNSGIVTVRPKWKPKGEGVFKKWPFD